MFTSSADTIRAPQPPLELVWRAADEHGERHGFPPAEAGLLPMALCGRPGGPNFNEHGATDCRECRSVLRLVLAGRVSAVR